jgi:alpha-mannosidase
MAKLAVLASLCLAAAASAAVINVHVAPHTHDDVGWDETYMQYYQGDGPIGGRNVTRILTAVVAGLLQDPKRRFSYVEQAYFQIWFETQSPATQAAVRGLVASKQLIFLNGGWSMHDEASPSFVDMLDNTAVGQRSIVDNFGITSLPTLTWQIDPLCVSRGQIDPNPARARAPSL